MRISQLAREVGVSADTIRYYEREGLLPSVERSENGYREYGPVDAEHLRLLVELRRRREQQHVARLHQVAYVVEETKESDRSRGELVRAALEATSEGTAAGHQHPESRCTHQSARGSVEQKLVSLAGDQPRTDRHPHVAGRQPESFTQFEPFRHGGAPSRRVDPVVDDADRAWTALA